MKRGSLPHLNESPGPASGTGGYRCLVSDSVLLFSGCINPISPRQAACVKQQKDGLCGLRMGYFSCCCKQMPHKKLLDEEGLIWGEFVGIIYHGGEGMRVRMSWLIMLCLESKSKSKQKKGAGHPFGNPQSSHP